MIRNSSRLVKGWNFIKPIALPKRFQSESSGGTNTRPSIAERVYPTPMEKRFIVWMGKYKTVDEVPDSVSVDTIYKAKNKARIRIANYMMVATVIGCLTMVYIGKQEAKKGRSVLNDNLEWHANIKEEYEKKGKEDKTTQQ